MKKTIRTILMAAGIIAAMASCKKNEIDHTGSDNSIGFIVEAADTKGSAITNGNITTDCSSFKCDVWMASAPISPLQQHYVTNGTVSYAGSAWKFTTPTEQPKWINGIETQFWAWAPESLSPSDMAANASQISFNYTLPDANGTSDATNQKDILFAYSTKTFHRANPSDAEVTITFKHALPQLNFTVVAESIGAIDITSLKIENVASGGAFTFSKAEEFTCTPSGKATYSQNNPFDGASEGMLKGQKAFTTVDNFFMIPQTLGSEAKITVTRSNGEILSAALNETWGSGTTYNYKLAFNEHELTVTLVSWTDDTGVTIQNDKVNVSMPLWESFTATDTYTGEQL